MRASIVIPVHDEGELLLKTVESCAETIADLDCEILIADDASRDDSVREVRRHYPQVRVAAHRKRRGCPATKDLGGRRARGDVLVFLDGHCKPERFGLRRLIRSVEELDGESIVTPRIPALDCAQWKNQMYAVGHGFGVNLETLDGCWVDLKKMRPRGRFYESPAAVGCCMAMSRELYAKLRGFDRHMVEWGIEDVDFGLKAWLMGHSILHDRDAIVGHRFRGSFENYTVATESILANKVRMARKNFTEAVWDEWLHRFRRPLDGKLWKKAWRIYRDGEGSAERERAYLLKHRARDEFWYAHRFGLEWPVAEPGGAGPRAAAPARRSRTARSRGKQGENRAVKRQGRGR